MLQAAAIHKKLQAGQSTQTAKYRWVSVQRIPTHRHISGMLAACLAALLKVASHGSFSPNSQHQAQA